jgi:GAF domain-containing protein
MFTLNQDSQTQDKPMFYIDLAQSLRNLLGEERDPIANMANMASLLYFSLPSINWSGFYLFDGQELVLGPFHGKPACVRIQMGKGVCGTSAINRETLMIENVHEFPGHIACDADSKSEIVIPMIKDDTIRYYMYKIPADVNVFCAFDACNSGSVCDLKYSIYETSYRKDITKKLKNYDYREWNKRQIVKFQENYLETSANIVSFSGCSDDQYSYEMGRNGALTTAMLKVLKACGPDVKLEDLILHLRGTILVWRLKQSPGMTSGKNLDMTKSLSEFIM